MEDLAEYADRIIVLDDGKKILDDRPAQIFAKRETLADCGLDVPETVKLADKLRANGYQIPQNVIREKELLDYLGNCTNSTAGRKSVDTENRLDAVSYTHLRAHETDSYLVCRLLLEKKKRPNAYTTKKT